VLQEITKETSHQDHFYGKQGVDYSSRRRGDNFSKPRAQSVSGAGLKLTEFVPHPPTECGHSYRKHGKTSRKLSVDSECGNQGEYQTQ
jgi:hypothetical protein